MNRKRESKSCKIKLPHKIIHERENSLWQTLYSLIRKKSNPNWGNMVKQTVEDTLNAMLDAEADEITKAYKYERTEKRIDTRAGHYNRKLATEAGEITLKMPKLQTLPFETAIIERYKRREESVEEALIEMSLAAVSVRRVEDISEALWGS